MAAGLKMIYTAAMRTRRSGAAGVRGLGDGQEVPGRGGVWERAWDRFIPFLEFPPA